MKETSLQDLIKQSKAALVKTKVSKCSKHDWKEVMYTRCALGKKQTKQAGVMCGTQVQKKCATCGKTARFNEYTGKIISR
jgi:hypothetical protein